MFLFIIWKWKRGHRAHNVKMKIKTLIGTDGFTPEGFMDLPISSGYKFLRFNDEN